MYNTCECPYCGHENKIDNCEGNSFDYECSSCGEEFEVEVECEPVFNTNKIEYINCDECGKEERTSDMRYEDSCFPYPEKYKGTKAKLCIKCYTKGISDDWETVNNRIDDYIKTLIEEDKISREKWKNTIRYSLKEN